MRRQLILLVTSLLFQGSLFGRADKERIIGIINEQVKEVYQLSKRIYHQDPNLILRLSELHLEKARLVREDETERYLNSKEGKKSNYFKKSRRDFKKAEELALKVTQNFPDYSEKYRVYFILGHHAKEFGNFEKGIKYFRAAMKDSPRESEAKTKAALAAAELFYNQGEYKKSQRLYEKYLDQHEDKWWTKHAYNYSWTLYHTEDVNKAGRVLKKVIERSQSGDEYIDLSTMALKDYPLFLAESGNTEKALTILSKQSPEKLGKVIQILGDRGRADLAKKMARGALSTEGSSDTKLKIIQSDLNVLFKRDLYSTHYSNYKDYSKSFIEDKKILSFLIKEGKKMAGILQKQAFSGNFKRLPKKQRDKANLSSAYFRILEKIDSQNKGDYVLFQGENFYATKQFSTAMKLYQRSQKISNITKNRSNFSKSILGLLACLENPSIPEEKKKPFYEMTYESLVKINPKGKRSKNVLPKLFRIKMNNNDSKGAMMVLTKFNELFPDQNKVIEPMVVELSSLYKREKKASDYRTLLEKVVSKNLKTNRRFISKSKDILTSFDFKNAEKNFLAGNIENAEKKYLALVKSPSTKKSVKAVSFFNLAVINKNKGNWKSTVTFGKYSVNLMTPSEVLKYKDQLVSLVDYFMLRLLFKESNQILSQIIEKTCKKIGNIESSLFGKLITIKNADQKYKESENLIFSRNRCFSRVAQRDQYLKELIGLYKAKGKKREISQIIGRVTGSAYSSPSLVPVYFRLIEEGAISQRQIEQLKDELKRFRGRVASNSIEKDMIESFEVENLKLYRKEIFSETLRFPVQAFGSILKTKIAALGRYLEAGKSIELKRLPITTVKLSRARIEVLRELIGEIKAFKPPGLGKEQLRLFQSSMSGNIKSLEDKVSLYKKQVLGILKKTDSLSRNNFSFVEAQHYRFVENISKYLLREI